MSARPRTRLKNRDRMGKPFRRTSVTLQGAMLDAVDDEVAAHPEFYPNRSEWVHRAITEKLKKDRRQE